jgi:RNA polymerase subunit RPABC4/transcription elongation factor Spt4
MRFLNFLAKRGQMLVGSLCGRILPAGTTCPKCGGKHFEKETDIMDVWFDSGSSMKQFAKCVRNWLGRLICIWKAVTSIAAGSNLHS